MGNRTWKGMTVKLDGSTGTATDLTAYCNSVDPKGKLALLDDTSLNDEEESFVAGLAGATVGANFFSNSTTDLIFSPLLGNRTTVTKTLRVYNGNKWFAGEVLCNGVAFSGKPGSLQLWSVDMTFDGLVSNTTS
jgi:hypothetical protein